VRRFDRKAFLVGLIGGVSAVLAYVLVIFAKTIALLGAVRSARAPSRCGRFRRSSSGGIITLAFSA
jgi:hypothetical protein